MRKTHNVLAIADCHGTLTDARLLRILRGRGISAVFFLGDNYPVDVETVLRNIPKNTPMLGVVGNHDMPDYLTRYGITDVHCRTTSLFGYTVGGFEGCARYRITKKRIMYGNLQSERLLERLPHCDIFLSHDRARFRPYRPKKGTIDVGGVHAGLTGIAKYLKREAPRYHFFGHYHIRLTLFYRHIRCQCVFRAQVVRVKAKEKGE